MSLLWILRGADSCASAAMEFRGCPCHRRAGAVSELLASKRPCDPESSVMDARPFANYGVLGRVEVTTQSGTVQLTRAQRALVVALLLERNRPVPTSRLADAVWGDQQPSDPNAALRSQIARLRRALGPIADDLDTADGAYRLSVDPARVDMHRFEDLLNAAKGAPPHDAQALLHDALGLWRGDALEEFADRPFAQPDAVRLDELRLEACEQRGHLLLLAGRPAEVVPVLQELLVAHPERERARELLMEALYRTGRHTDALGVYEQWRRHLSEDRGLEPSPALQQLEGDILRHTIAVPQTSADLESGQAPAAPLPRPVSSFVGREHDLEVLNRLLSESRLITLTGPGGVGKTRLALEAAGRVEPTYPGGVVFCDLRSIRRNEGVASALAATLNFRERAGLRMEDQLISGLADRRTLVVLDNCEHVAAGATSLAEQLTQRTRTIDVLITSRERLHADGERTLVVAPLGIEGDRPPAVELFIQRASAAGAPPPESAEELANLRELCRRLDGLPLAIELAAARSAALTVTDLMDGLAHR
ncbi:MAG: hypothetical protein QOJ19_3416, partial [Acidimicrobiia bacterium]|nr:hypothetical protein [Acidimicrobiia bacterium]